MPPSPLTGSSGWHQVCRACRQLHLLHHPRSVEHADSAEMIAAVKALNEELPEESRVEVDDAFVAKCAHGARAVLNPLCAIFGGFIGQEVIEQLFFWQVGRPNQISFFLSN